MLYERGIKGRGKNKIGGDSQGGGEAKGVETSNHRF